jgi:hypothetical protein
MQNFSKETSLLKEFHKRHKSIIDALAKDDEMFKAIKEIAETKDRPGSFGKEME